MKDNSQAMPQTSERGIVASKLISSQKYQRKLNQKNVETIVSNYRKELVDPLKVSLRDGKYYVFDGQTTLAALRVMFGDDCIVPCRVYSGLSYEDEAELFRTQNVCKKILTKNDELRAGHEAKDSKIIEFESVLASAGYSEGYNGNRGVHTLSCCNFLYNKVFLLHGKDHLSRVLNIVKASWHDNKDSLKQNIFQGMDTFLMVYGDSVVDNELVEKLRCVSPIEILNNGYADRVHKSTGCKYAYQMFLAYNKQRKTKRLPDKL